MRIKLQSFPPLPALRAWFIIHSATTVEELKSVLCQELPALRDRDLEFQDISLIIDDFELLDFSPIDVVRDGDLVLIKQRSRAIGEKRKAALDNGYPIRKRAKRSDEVKQSLSEERASSEQIQRPKASLRATTLHKAGACSLSGSSHPTPATKSDSDTSSTSTSESESASDSDTDTSSSESSSESESSSAPNGSITSTTSAPSIAPTRPIVMSTPGASQTPAKATRIPAKTNSTDGKATAAPSSFVPPGLGKPATHGRNFRRRRKRMFERLAATVEPARVNEIPLGTRAQTVPAAPPPVPIEAPTLPDDQVLAAQDDRPPVFMMSSLQNKNKKKGFKKTMKSNIPAKIVFSSTAEEAAVEQTLKEAIPFTNAEDREMLATFARLVPPSEKQEKGLLPSNMFVTSVDVEADLPRKRKKKKQERVGPCEHDVVEDIKLPYDDPVDITVTTALPSNVTNVVTTATSTISRQEVESKWTALPKVQEASQLQPDMFVGWKELGINPQTVTPEMLLNVGRIVSCEQELVVEQHFEHPAAEVSFGGLVTVEDEQNVELAYNWADVFQGDWRIIRAS